MATVTRELNVLAAKFEPAGNFPRIVQAVGTNFPVPGLLFDAATDQEAFLTFKAVDYGTGNLTLDLEWYAENASANNIVWEANISAYTLNSTDGSIEADALATLNFVQDTHLATTAKRLHTCQIALSNLDSLAADDRVTLRVARDADGTNATDDMANGGILTGCAVSYSDT